MKANERPNIFVSYRRDDSQDASLLICERLVREFGKGHVFFDIDIPTGTDWRAAIELAIDQSRVVVVVIGPKWLDLLIQRGNKGNPDWVRHEVELALKKGIDVFPVLVNNATRPTEDMLPRQLKQLPSRMDMEIHPGKSFRTDLELLVTELHKLLEMRGFTSPHTDLPDGASFWDQQEGRRRGSIALTLVMLCLAWLFVWRELWPPLTFDRGELGHLLFANCWITYDPRSMRLDPKRIPVYPSLDEIETELDLIKTAGFSGILTSTSRDVMSEVPRLAKKRGLKVIMGIWNINDRREVSRAIRQQRFVDAYCVGSSGLRDRYQIQELERVVYLVKRRTGRPVACSELAAHYDARLARIGDWLFPDAHLTVKASPDDLVATVNIDRDIEYFMQSTVNMATFAHDTGKALVFKNVAYPHGGTTGATRASQAEFFRRLLQWLNDPQRGPSVKVTIVAQSAFDTPWKTRFPFLSWDPKAGLIDLGDAAPKSPLRDGQFDHERLISPAAREILRWYPHLSVATPSGRNADDHAP